MAEQQRLEPDSATVQQLAATPAREMTRQSPIKSVTSKPAAMTSAGNSRRLDPDSALYQQPTTTPAKEMIRQSPV